MSTQPLVTFIVPAYNHASYIRLCLDKIAEEPYPAKELLIIDDGSTDRTADVIRAWIAEKTRAFPVEFISRPNQGVTRTMNELIAKARGVYLRPCSSDDYVIPGTLQPMLDLLEQRPEKRLVFGDAIVIDQDNRQISSSTIFAHYRGRKENYATDDGLREEVVRRWSLAGPVQFSRRDLFAEIGGYDETLKIEDWDMMLRVVARNYAVFLDQPVAAYRVHGLNSFKVIQQKEPHKSAVEYLRILEKNHTLFEGRVGRRMDYMLHRQRGIVRHLKGGAYPTKMQMMRIRLSAIWQTLTTPLRGKGRGH